MSFGVLPLTNDNNSNFFFVVAVFTGKMFKSAELIYPIAFFQMFYNDKPVDWLLEHLIYTKVCNWEKDMVRERKRFRIMPHT